MQNDKAIPGREAELEQGDLDSANLSAGFMQDVYLTLPREQFPQLKATLLSTKPLLAPLNAGQRVGRMILTVNGNTIAEYPVVALETISVAGYFRRLWDSIELLWKK